MMKTFAIIVALLLAVPLLGHAQESEKRTSSYAPVDLTESFASVESRMKSAKAGVMTRQMTLLNERYDLANRAATGVTMSKGKAIQDGVRVKLSGGMTWDKLAAMAPSEE